MTRTASLPKSMRANSASEANPINPTDLPSSGSVRLMRIGPPPTRSTLTLVPQAVDSSASAVAPRGNCPSERGTATSNSRHIASSASAGKKTMLSVRASIEKALGDGRRRSHALSRRRALKASTQIVARPIRVRTSHFASVLELWSAPSTIWPLFVSASTPLRSVRRRTSPDELAPRIDICQRADATAMRVGEKSWSNFRRLIRRPRTSTNEAKSRTTHVVSKAVRRPSSID